MTIKRIFVATILLMSLIINTLIAQAQTVDDYKVKKVVIDAGHGGKDPGALGKKSQEKKIALAIALKTGNYIKQNIPGVEVIYTRQTDEFITLKRRTEIANENNADVFISIHCNANKSSKVYGSSTYVNGLSKDATTLSIQKLENGDEDFKEEDYILLSNQQNIHLGSSSILAGKIQDQFRTRAGRKDNGVKQACFAVLWRTKMPAVLVEVGFISNPTEEKYMMTDDGQSYLASAIYRAFKEYKYAMEGVTPPAKEPNKPSSSGSDNSSISSSNSDPDNNTDNKIYFRVQVKSSTEKIALNSKVFKGLKVEEIKIDGVYKYTVGKTQDYKKIIKTQNETREKIKDAYLIATKGNKKIDIKDAKKELGIKN